MYNVLMKTSTKIILGIVIVVLLCGWFLFRSSTDEIHSNDSRISTVLIFDVPMVYIKNCSQCSLSPRAQDVNVFLVPQTFLYNSTGFLDDNSVVSQVEDGQFTIREVFTNHPHGLETAFRSNSTYLVVTDQQGFKSVVYEDVNQIIEFGISNATKETLVNSRLISDVESLDIFWVAVELNPRLFGDFSNTPLPDDVENRKKVVEEIQNEFLSKLPDEQKLQYKLDLYHPRIYLQLDKKDAILYMQAEQAGLNIDMISLYGGEGDPIVSQ